MTVTKSRLGVDIFVPQVKLLGFTSSRSHFEISLSVDETFNHPITSERIYFGIQDKGFRECISLSTTITYQGTQNSHHTFTTPAKYLSFPQ